MGGGKNTAKEGVWYLVPLANSRTDLIGLLTSGDDRD